MNELEQVKEAYNRMRKVKEENTINLLRLRADVAVAIHYAHEAGYTNYAIAKYLDVNRTEVGRLQAGYLLPPGRLIPLSDAQALADGLVEAVGSPVPETPSEAAEPVPRALTVCRYCSDPAEYALKFNDGRVYFVCGRHKPKDKK